MKTMHLFAGGGESHCDISKPKQISRATWVCDKCGRDISLEYLFWYEAVHGNE